MQNFCDQAPDEYWYVTPSGPSQENGGRWKINSLPWNAEVPLHTMTYNTAQQWAFHGSSGNTVGHPMHTHVWHQQICGTGTPCTDRCGMTMEYDEFVDSVKVFNSNNDPCYNCFKTVKYSGKVILQRHYLFHKDIEMMVWVNTVGGPDNLPLQ